MLSDHPLSTSGVATQSRWLINGLLATGKYSFRCFGGAIKHQDYRTIVVNDDFIIKPTDGFGDENLLRRSLATEKPDAVLLFTDPRFFTWVFEMEDEIHQVCPIVYNHLWDNGPWPEFNRSMYESVDLVNCINYPTYEMVVERFPHKTNYIPHAVPIQLYYPLQKNEIINHKQRLLGKERANHFVVLFVGRNARRKMPGDLLVSWKLFLDKLQITHGHKNATLVMHTDPLDKEGPNLYHVTNMLGIVENVVFSNNIAEFNQMNILYNIADVVVNRSINEGFGLPTLEAMMAGKPIIAVKTGGLTRQVENPKTGEQHGIGLEPEIKSLVGNQLVPYIYEDYVSNETVANAFMKMYEFGDEEREKIGIKAMNYARENYNLDYVISEWDRTLTDTIENWKSRYNRWRVVEL